MPTSRISGACNGCRAKKQKCSGDRAGCSQCAMAGIQCTWPEQRKRGPAKGYIEALEMRLHAAETLLLALLPMIDQNTLDTATEKAGEIGGEEDDDRRACPVALNKKTGVDYWDNFPLDTSEGVRRWQRDCERHSHGQSQISLSISRPHSQADMGKNHIRTASHSRSDEYQSSVAAAATIAGMRHTANSPGSALSRSYDQGVMPVSMSMPMSGSMPISMANHMSTSVSAPQSNWLQLSDRPEIPEPQNHTMASQDTAVNAWIEPGCPPGMMVVNSSTDDQAQSTSLYSGQFQPSFFW